MKFSELVVAGVCCGLLQAAVVNAQDIASSRAGWRTTVELSALWHAGGAVAPDQPAHYLSRTGLAAGIGIGRFASNGAGLRLAVRGTYDADTTNVFGAPCPIPAGFGSLVGPRQTCYSHAGSFAVLGISLDLASGISPTGLPLGIETGPDVFRSLSRPHYGLIDTPPVTIVAGWHSTLLLELGRRSPFKLTAGANWLSGGILTWTFPVGLRYAF